METQAGNKRGRADGGQMAPRKKPADGDIDDLIDESFDMDMEEEEFIPNDIEIDGGVLGQAGKNWQRPEPDPHNPSTDSLG